MFKVNERFKFPETINLDRYSHTHARVTAEKRKKAFEWEQQKAALEEQLNVFNNYKNLGFPLLKMVEGTLEFAKEKRSDNNTFQTQLEEHLMVLTKYISQQTESNNPLCCEL